MYELKQLIDIIQDHFDAINKKWKQSSDYLPLNMKKSRVEDIYKDESLLLYVFNYRKFINDNITGMVDTIQEQKFLNVVNTRVKALNSIQYKIQNYYFNHENGKIALKKCLNDIFGIRMIFDEHINFNEIKTYIKKEFPNLK